MCKPNKSATAIFAFTPNRTRSMRFPRGLSNSWRYAAAFQSATACVAQDRAVSGLQSQLIRSADRGASTFRAAAVVVAALGAGAGLAVASTSCEEAKRPLTAEEVRFPPIEPFNKGTLKVSDVHTLYYEECGNPQGKPVIIVHGGPGGGCSVGMRRYHDPKYYRIILLDQRGAGRSTPHASLHENTTWHLIDDMEKLRRHLKVDRWQVFGGSWGSTLSLAYAEVHPTRVTELIIYGIFLLRKSENNFFYQHGTNFLYPDRWEMFRNAIPEAERGDLLRAYHRRLMSEDAAVRLQAAQRWTAWELSTIRLVPPSDIESIVQSDLQATEAIARIESHYLVNGGFLPSETFLLDNAYKIRHIPTVIIHGRYDMVCPMATAWELHKTLPEADFRIVQAAGHAGSEPENSKELVEATNRFKLA